MAIRQRAYTGYAEAGDDRRAAWMSARLCLEHFFRDESSVGAGWFARTQRHAKVLPDCVELGFAALLEATVLRFSGDLDTALPLTERATEIAQRFGDRDLLGLAIHTQGLILIDLGRVAEGVALLDEAMTSVVAGELNDYFTGAIYCNVIGACLEIADVRRAGEWGEAARAWAESIPPESPYPGMCRINRAALASLRGDWPQADAEAVRAAEELLSLNPGARRGGALRVGRRAPAPGRSGGCGGRVRTGARARLRAAAGARVAPARAGQGGGGRRRATRRDHGHVGQPPAPDAPAVGVRRRGAGGRRPGRRADGRGRARRDGERLQRPDPGGGRGHRARVAPARRGRRALGP